MSFGLLLKIIPTWEKKVIERMNGVNFKREYMIEVFDDNFVYANSLLISRNSLYIIPANSDACK